MWGWLSFAVRRLHVISAIAWIGSSFYFVALDLGLKKSPMVLSACIAKSGRFTVAGSITFKNIWSHRQTCHAGAGNPTWALAVTVILFIGIMWLSTAPLRQQSVEASEARPLSRMEQVCANAEGFDDVHDIILGRCSVCHAREPVWDGIRRAPKNVLLETRAEIAAAARLIYLQADDTQAMPPANLSFMEEDERTKIIRWYRSATTKMQVSMVQE